MLRFGHGVLEFLSSAIFSSHFSIIVIHIRSFTRLPSKCVLIRYRHRSPTCGVIWFLTVLDLLSGICVVKPCLPARKLAGFESQGMVLCATSKEGKTETGPWQIRYIYIYIWSDSDWKDVIALHKEPMWPALLGGSTFSTGTGGFNLWNLGRQL